MYLACKSEGTACYILVGARVYLASKSVGTAHVMYWVPGCTCSAGL